MVELLVDSPLLGVTFEASTRKLALPGIPFNLIYSVEQRQLLIIAWRINAGSRATGLTAVEGLPARLSEHS